MQDKCRDMHCTESATSHFFLKEFESKEKVKDRYCLVLDDNMLMSGFRSHFYMTIAVVNWGQLAKLNEISRN